MKSSHCAGGSREKEEAGRTRRGGDGGDGLCGKARGDMCVLKAIEIRAHFKTRLPVGWGVEVTN